MEAYSEKNIACPHCGHHFDIALDASQGSQIFYYDCPACCHAIHLNMVVDELADEIKLYIDADDEQIF